MYNEEFIRKLLCYGRYLTDFEIDNDQGCYRVRVIKYDETGKLYWLLMHNGEFVEFLEVK